MSAIAAVIAAAPTASTPADTATCAQASTRSGSASIPLAEAPATPLSASPAGSAGTPTPAFGDDPGAQRVYASDGRYPHEVWTHPRTRADGSGYLHHRTVINDGIPGVVIVPITEAGDMVLTRQWRPVLGQWMWEFPRGYGEGEGSLREAARELVEETGLVALDLLSAARIHPDSGTTFAPADVVIAHVEVSDQDRHSLAAGPEEHDISAVRLFPARTVDRMVLAGRITDAYTLAALCLVKTVLR